MQAYSALLIEDDIDWISYFQEIIEKSPKNCFKFDYAKTLAEGHELLSTNSYEMIILDLMLPDCQGENTILALKDKIQYLPVIIITALIDEHIRKFCFENGVDDYLVKSEYTDDTFFHVAQTVINKTIIKIEKELTNVSEKLNLLKATLTNILNNFS